MPQAVQPTSQYTIQEMAAEIRRKTGAYKDWPDDHLVQEWVKKYPVYKRWVSSSTTPILPSQETEKPQSFTSRVWDAANFNIPEYILGIKQEHYDSAADRLMKSIKSVETKDGVAEASTLDIAKRTAIAAIPYSVQTGLGFFTPLNLALGAVWGRAARTLKNLKDVTAEKAALEQLFSKATAAKNTAAAKEIKSQLDYVRDIEGQLHITEKTTRATGAAASAGFVAEGGINYGAAIRDYREAKTPEEQHEAFIRMLQGAAVGVGGLAGIEAMRTMRPKGGPLRPVPAFKLKQEPVVTTGPPPTTSGKVTTTGKVKTTGPSPIVSGPVTTTGSMPLTSDKVVTGPTIIKGGKEKVSGLDIPLPPTQSLAPFEDLPTTETRLRQKRKGEEGVFRVGTIDDPLLEKIDFRGARKGPIERFREAGLKDNFITNWIDNLSIVWKVEEAASKTSPLGINDSPYYSFRRARSHTAKAKSFLHFGPESPISLKPIGPSLQDILSRISDKTIFSGYLQAKYTVKQAAAGGTPIINKGEADAFLQKWEPRFQQQFTEAEKQLGFYKKGLLQYAEESGALGEKQLGAISTALDNHVALDKILDFESTPPSGGAVKIPDPLETIIKNTFTIVDVIENNAARQKLATLIDQSPDTVKEWITPVSATKPRPVAKVTINELKKFLDDNGVDTSFLSKDQLEAVYTVFRPSVSIASGKDYMSVLFDGKRQLYEIKNTALAEAVKHYSDSPDLLSNMFLRFPAQVVRTSATLALSFTTRNIIRDTFTAAVQSKYGFTPVVDSLRGLAHMLKRDELYREFLSSGGAQSALVSVDRNVVRGQLQRLLKGQLHTTTAHPLDLLRALSESMENATRVGAFAKAMSIERKKGTNLHEASARAAMEARDITVDFMRGGKTARSWNKNTAFFNAMIQGNVRAIEAFKAQPLEAFARATMYATIPTILLYGLNRNNPVWRSKPQYEKDAFLFVPLNGWESFTSPITGNVAADEFLRVPKPHGLITDVFSRPYEAFLDFATQKDPQAVDDMFNEMGTELLMGTLGKSIPSSVLPFVEVAANYSFYRRQNLTSPYDLEIEPALRYNRWTTQTAKEIGAMFNVAPTTVDHLLFAWFTSLGREASGIADPLGVKATEWWTGEDIAFPEKPATTLTSMPFGIGEQTPLVGTLLSGGVDLQTKTLSKFYDDMASLNGVKRSLSLAKTRQNGPLYRRLVDENLPLLRRERVLRASYEGMAVQLRRVDRIYEDTKMTRQRKQEELAGIYRRINNMAARATGGAEIPPTSWEKERAVYMEQFKPRPLPPPPG